MAPYTPQPASPDFLRARAAWSSREAEILDGASLPTIDDFRAGHSCINDDLREDLLAQAKRDLDSGLHSGEVEDLLANLQSFPTSNSCWAVYQVMGKGSGHADVYLFHAALRAHPDAIVLWASDLSTPRDPKDRIGHMMGLAVALGMLASLQQWDPDPNATAYNVRELRDHGLGVQRRGADTLREWDWATEQLEWDNMYADQKKPDRPAKRNLDKALAAIASLEADADFLRAVEEDRAEIPQAHAPSKPRGPERPVVPQVLLLRPDSKHRKEIVAAALPIAGKPLPLVGGGRLAEARALMHESHPHCQEQTDRILTLQAGREFPVFRMILVGEAGGGKTAYAVKLAESLGMPVQVVPAGAASDGSFGGTSTQYSSGRMSTPLQFVCETAVANPMIVVDEADKIGTGRHNGNLGDVLLNFVEPSTAARYLDPGLETSVDLSAVSWILCANDLSTIPVPLRDRCRIVRIPRAGFEHIGPIADRIIREVAEERGLNHPAWRQPLAPDELEVVGQAWGGGSLRHLNQILEDFIVNREQSMGMN